MKDSWLRKLWAAARSLVISCCIVITATGALPLWLVFAAIMRRIPTSHLRHRGKLLQTPIVTYEHPTTKRKVVLVGVMHAGDRGYFSHLQKIIDSKKGYAVLFEGIDSLSSTEERRLTKNEQEVFESIENLGRANTRVLKTLGLEHQADVLKYRRHWKNTDVKMRKLVGSLSRDRKNPFSRFGGKKKKTPNAIVMRWFLNFYFKNAVAIEVLLSVVQIRDDVILHDRDLVAFKGIKKEVAKKDVVAIWGAAHVPGIAKYLRTIGFLKTTRTWVTAYRVRKYSLRRMLRELIREARRKRKKSRRA